MPSRNFYGTGIMTTGSGSSFPLTRLAARYNQMKKDGRVLSNRNAIDVIDTRISQLLERIDLNEAPERMVILSEMWKQYELELDSGQNAAAYMTRKSISAQFEKAYHDYMAWKQTFEALDLRGKMVEREVKVLKEIHAIMTAEDAYELVAKLMAAVIRVNGDDPKKIKQVQHEFTRIIGESSDLSVEGSAEEIGGDSEEGGDSGGSGEMDREELLYPGDAQRPEIEG